MERLTKRDENGNATKVKSSRNTYICTILEDEAKFDAEILERLAEYEDAEEAGLIMRFPCPLGTTVYHIGLEIPDDEEQCYECRYNCSGFGEFHCDKDYDSGWPIMEDLLNGKHKVCPKFKPCLNTPTFDLNFYSWYKNWFGITWFLTKEESEQKLKELKKYEL